LLHFFRRRARPALPAADAPSFDATLAVTPPGDPAALAEAMAVVREALPEADNFGETGDARDWYHLLDTLTAGVEAAFPQSLCRAGCSSCCHYPVGLFTLTYSEWRVIERHLEQAWSEADREALVARYEATYTGFWRVLISLVQRNIASLLLAAPLLEAKRLACPLLVNDRCGVYPARPFPCRTFGLFMTRTLGKQPRIYACGVQGEQLGAWMAGSEPQLQLPVLDPIARAIRLRCQGPKLALPLWVGIWVARRRARLA
jgi:Fe-S-cluster containining protein